MLKIDENGSIECYVDEKKIRIDESASAQNIKPK